MRVAIVIVDRRRDATPSKWIAQCCCGSSGQHEIKWAAAAVVELRSSDSDPIDSDNQHDSTSLSSSSATFFFFFSSQRRRRRRIRQSDWYFAAAASALRPLLRCGDVSFLRPEQLRLRLLSLVEREISSPSLMMFFFLNGIGRKRERERGEPTDRMRACVQLSSLPRDIRRRATTVCVCALSSLYCSVLFFLILCPTLLPPSSSAGTNDSLFSSLLFSPLFSSFHRRRWNIVKINDSISFPSSSSSSSGITYTIFFYFPVVHHRRRRRIRIESRREWKQTEGERKREYAESSSWVGLFVVLTSSLVSSTGSQPQPRPLTRKRPHWHNLSIAPIQKLYFVLLFLLAGIDERRERQNVLLFNWNC